MPDIFDEVDEDLRADQARALLRRFGGLLVVAMLLTLAGVGGYQWWQEKQAVAVDAVATRFMAAQEQAKKDPKAALAAFNDVAASAPEGYRILSELQRAALEWDQGQHDKALGDWRAVADDKAVPQLLRDLATLTSVQHQIDTGDAKALKESLSPITTGASRLKPLALEASALLDLRLNRAQEAQAIFKSLATGPDTPDGVRQMARDILVTLGEQGAGPHG